jgi:hypothetical protein
MVRNVGAYLYVGEAYGIGFANIRVRPHDIIEVIRFIYLSPREDSPTTNKSKVGVTEY